MGVRVSEMDYRHEHAHEHACTYAHVLSYAHLSRPLELELLHGVADLQVHLFERGWGLNLNACTPVEVVLFKYLIMSVQG